MVCFRHMAAWRRAGSTESHHLQLALLLPIHSISFYLSPALYTHSMASQDKPVNVKLLLIGNSSVGKSSLLLRFSDEQWLPEDESSATIGVDFRVRNFKEIIAVDPGY